MNLLLFLCSSSSMITVCVLSRTKGWCLLALEIIIIIIVATS
jgi:hypothetical protein